MSLEVRRDGRGEPRWPQRPRLWHPLGRRVLSHQREGLGGRDAWTVGAKEGAGADAALRRLVCRLVVERRGDAEDAPIASVGCILWPSERVVQGVRQVEHGSRVAAVHEEHQRRAASEADHPLERVVGDEACVLIVARHDHLVETVRLVAAPVFDLRAVARIGDPSLPVRRSIEPPAQRGDLRLYVGACRREVAAGGVREEADAVA